MLLSSLFKVASWIFSFLTKLTWLNPSWNLRFQTLSLSHALSSDRQFADRPSFDHDTYLTKVAELADKSFRFDHNHPEDVIHDRSFSNAFEVEMACALIEHLINTKEYSFCDIAVLAPYSSQLAALQKPPDTQDENRESMSYDKPFPIHCRLVGWVRRGNLIRLRRCRMFFQGRPTATPCGIHRNNARQYMVS